jgi:hypothetical protein
LLSIASAPTTKLNARNLTNDTVMMQRSTVDHVSISVEDITSDRVWSEVESLAELLPYPSAKASKVNHRDIVSALIYSRLNKTSRVKAAPLFNVSENTLERRYRVWRDLDTWQKIEAITAEIFRH